MGGFVGHLKPINALADRNPEHIWRLQDEDGDATAIRAYPEDPSLLVTLSVWTSINALFDFAYSREHAAVMRGRAQWFEEIDEPYIVLWYVRKGTVPSLDEAKMRLAYLRVHGSTPRAFNFKNRFLPEEAAELEAFHEGRIVARQSTHAS